MPEVILIGGGHLVEALAKLGAEGPRELAKSLHEEALEAFAESQRQVPRKTGVLANSGVVLEPVVSGTTVTQDLGYGGAASKYALIVHEDLNANHPRGGKAKYLEDPVTAQVQGMDERIAARLEEVIAE